MYCTNCGEKINDKGHFCKACGHKIGEENRKPSKVLDDIINFLLKKSTIIFAIIFAIYVTLSYVMFLAANEFTDLFHMVEAYGVHGDISEDEFKEMSLAYMISLVPLLLLGIMIKFFRRNPLFKLTNITVFIVLIHALISHSSMRGSKKVINQMVEEGLSYPLPFVYTAYISFYLCLAIISFYIVVRTSPKFGLSVKNMETKVSGYIKAKTNKIEVKQ